MDASVDRSYQVPALRRKRHDGRGNSVPKGARIPVDVVEANVAVTFVGLAAAIVLFWAFHREITELSLRSLCNVATASAALTIWAVSRISAKRIWSASAVYLLMFALFHMGLTTVLGLGMLDERSVDYATLDWISQWIHRSSTKEAVYLASLGLISCGAGICLAQIRRSNNGMTQPDAASGDQAASAYLALTGGLLVLLSIAAWFAFMIASGGPGALFGSYADYQGYIRETSGLVGTIYFFMGVGLAFLAASDHTSWRRTTLVAFGVFALFALPLGLRGEVLFPSLTAAVLAAKRGWSISTRSTLAIGLALLLMISAIKNLRQVGVENIGSSGLNGSVTAGLVELGGSLRPVSEVVLWYRQGEALDGGQTYWAPFDRVLCRVIAPQECIPSEADDRIMNVLVIDRVGPIGFSPIAEAYRNFGREGVVVVMLLMGAVLGWMDHWRNSRMALAITGIILIEMLINVRNSFVAAPSHIVMGLVVLGFVMWVAHNSEAAARRQQRQFRHRVR